MNNFTRKLLPLACALLLVACGGAGAGGQGANKAASPAASQSASPASGAAQQPQPRAQTFRGLIGEKLRVQMSLRREGDALSGSYFYEGRKGELSLKGSVDGRGDFTLREYAAGGGAQTGTFKGKWGTTESGEAELTGEWSRPDGSRPSPFTLTELPVELAAGASVTTREIKEEKKRPRYTLRAEYPQIEGALTRFDGFNRAVASLAAAEADDFRKQMADWEEPPGSELGSYLEMGYSFGVANDDLVSVIFDIGDYYSGAAHPNHRTRVVNYDVRRGRALELADLFKPSALYLKALSDYCVKDLKRQFRAGGWSEPEQLDAGVEEGAAPDADNYRSWLITRRGLAVTFDPYQVAPYAAGPQHVLIPYSALRDLIDPDGPLAPFVR